MKTEVVVQPTHIALVLCCEPLGASLSIQTRQDLPANTRDATQNELLGKEGLFVRVIHNRGEARL